MAGKYDKKIKIKITDGGQLKRTTKDVDNLNKAVNNTNKSSGNFDRNMKGNARMSSNASKNFSKQAQGMQGVLVPAYAEVAARVFALSAAFNALSNAADYSIMLKGQTKFAQMTGKNMGRIAKHVQIASKGMLDFKEASTSAALASTAGLATKQIIRMTKSALDASAALGRSMTDTMDRLTRGIVKAEPEILDEIGVIIRLDTVYKKYAESVRKSTKDLTENEKLHARYTAILGQLSDKFGGIADELPANTFKQLSASVLDTVQKLSVGIVDWFGPFLKWLSESKTTILLLLAIITKNLIGKMFPAFAQMGARLAAMPDKMAKNTDRLRQNLERLNKEIYKGATARKNSISQLEKGLEKTLSGVLPKSQRSGPLQKLFDQDVKSLSSKKNRDAYLRSQRAIISYARRNLEKGTSGRVSGGQMAGASESQVAAAEARLDRASKASAALGKEVGMAAGRTKEHIRATMGGITAMKLGVAEYRAQVAGALSSTARYARSFSKNLDTRGILSGTRQNFAVIDKAFEQSGQQAKKWQKGMLKSFAVVQAGVVLLGKAMKGAMMALGVFSVASFFGSIMLGIDQTMSKARSAANTLNDEMDETITNIEKRRSDINFEGLSSSFSQSLRNANFAANVAEEISLAIETALKNIDVDLTGDTWGRIADNVADIFGAGLEDKLQDAISKIFKGLNLTGDLKGMDTEGLFKDIDASFNKRQKDLPGGVALIKNIKEAIISGDQKAIDNSLEKLESSGIGKKALTSIINRLEDFSKAVSDKRGVIARSLTDLSKQFDKYGRAEDKLFQGLVKKSDFFDLAAIQKEIVKIFENPKTEAHVKFQLLDVKGWLTKSKFIKIMGEEGTLAWSQFTEASSDLSKAEALLSSNKSKWSAVEIKNQQDVIKGKQKILNITQAQAIADLREKTGSDQAMVVATTGTGLDAVAEDQAGVLRATKLLELEQERGALKQLGTSTLESQAAITQQMMELELTGLNTKLLLIKASSSATEADQLQAAVNISIFKQKMEESKVSAVKLGKHLAKVEGITYKTSKYVAQMREDFKGSAEDFKKWETDTLTTTFNQIKNDTAHIRKNTRVTFTDQEKIASVLDSLQTARNKGVITSAKMLTTYQKAARLAYTTEGRLLEGKKQNLQDEIYILNNTESYQNKAQFLIDAEIGLLEMKRKVNEDGLATARAEVILLQLGVSIKKTKDDIAEADFTAKYANVADAMTQVATSFENAVSNLITDSILGREGKDWKEQLKEGLAKSAGDLGAKVLTDNIFGGRGKGMFNFGEEESSGLLHQLFKQFDKFKGPKGDEALDLIFPPNKRSVLVDTLKTLEKMYAELKAQTPKISITAEATRQLSTGKFLSVPNWAPEVDPAKKLEDGSFIPAKVLKEGLRSKLLDVKRAGVDNPAVHGVFVPALKAAMDAQIEYFRNRLKGEEEGSAGYKELKGKIDASEREGSIYKLDAAALGAHLIGLMTTEGTEERTSALADLSRQSFIPGTEALKAFEASYASNVSTDTWDSMQSGADALQGAGKGLDKLVFEFNRVMPLFGKAVTALSELAHLGGTRYRKPISTTDEDGNVIKGTVQVSEEVRGFEIAWFTSELASSMQTGMESLTEAVKDGKLTINGFNGKALEDASTKIIGVIKGTGLHIANFDGAALKQASDKIIGDGSKFNVHVTNFSEMPATAAPTAAAEPVELGKKVDSTNQLLASHSNGANSFQVVISNIEALGETLGKALMNSMESFFNLNQMDPGASIRPTDSKLGDILNDNLVISKEAYIAASSAGPGIGAEPIKLDWAAGQIDQGIGPSIAKILTSIDAHITQSQQFLDDMAVKTLDSLDTLISFEIAVPLEDAALNIGHFVEILDSKIVPIMDKLDPVLDKMPGLIDEMTITLKSVNDWIGPDTEDTGKDSGSSWNPFSFNTKGIEDAFTSKLDLSKIDFASSSVAMAGRGTDPAMDKIIQDILAKTKGIEIDRLKKFFYDNSQFKQDIEDFKFKKNKFEIKPAHKTGSSPKQLYNKTLPIMQHPDSYSKMLAKGMELDFKSKGMPLNAIQQKLPFTGAGIPTNSAVSMKLLPILTKISGFLQGLMPSSLAVDPRAKPYKKPVAYEEPVTKSLQEYSIGIVDSILNGISDLVGGKDAGAFEVENTDLATDLSTGIDKLVIVAKESLTELRDWTEAQFDEDLTVDEPKGIAEVIAGVSEGNALLVKVTNTDNTVLSGIKKSVEDGTTGGKKREEKQVDIGKRLGDGFADIITQQILNDNVNTAQLVSNLLTSVASQVMSTGISTWIASFADGGIVPGGFRAFASGGTVTKATLGLVGEGKYNEAVVPLPDGKSIPVMGATGSTENNITVNVTLNSNGDKDQGDTTSDGGESMKNLGHQLSQIVQAELIEQQRHGGLLSRY